MRNFNGHTSFVGLGELISEVMLLYFVRHIAGRSLGVFQFAKTVGDSTYASAIAARQVARGLARSWSRLSALVAAQRPTGGATDHTLSLWYMRAPTAYLVWSINAK